jgi:inner membrane protein
MDTITHGIAGALIGKAVCRGEDMFTAGPMNRGRIITWSLMLGAIFPDSDVIRDFLSSDKLLIVTWHRSLTHSLVLLPLWTLLLAGITRAFLNWRKWEAPSFLALSAIYAVGILSHILLDLVTTFGTMIWSPLEWSRPAWDLIFIVDFTLTAILLLPQLLAWVYSHPEKVNRRAVGMWVVFLPAPFLIARIGEIAGAPISDRVVLGAMVVFAVLILLPARFGWGVKIRHDKWNRAGLAAAVLYVACTFYAHHVALARIQKFAVLDHLQVESIGALPLPPSLWHWDGLVRTERGVYELRMDLADKTANSGNLLSLEHRYFPDAPPNSYIEVARRLPEVQKVLWFSRFPVTRFHKEGDVAVVEISDLRFPRARPGRPASFTYRVSFGAEGNVLSQGWVTR